MTAHPSHTSFSHLLHRIQSKSGRTAFQRSICPRARAWNVRQLGILLYHVQSKRSKVNAIRLTRQLGMSKVTSGSSIRTSGKLVRLNVGWIPLHSLPCCESMTTFQLTDFGFFYFIFFFMQKTSSLLYFCQGFLGEIQTKETALLTDFNIKLAVFSKPILKSILDITRQKWGPLAFSPHIVTPNIASLIFLYSLPDNEVTFF